MRLKAGVAVAASLWLSGCEAPRKADDPALDGIENAYKSGLMATVCLRSLPSADTPRLAAEWRRRDLLVRRAATYGLGPAFQVWRSEWEEAVATAEFVCKDAAVVEASLESWNNRLERALEELR